MGYTHYIEGLKSLSEDDILQWVSATNDMILIYNQNVKRLDKVVNCGSETLELSDTEVFVNGLGDNSCETLLINKSIGNFEFCKTRRLPYDAVVVASYMWASENFESVAFSSDGKKKDHRRGINLLNKYKSAQEAL